eukprot:scaffold226069_cov43-Prasinocladus_malaysianus.AAC.1
MLAMSRPTYSAITAHAKDAKPAIVFVPTRKHARLTALDLLTFAAAEGEPARFLQSRATCYAAGGGVGSGALLGPRQRQGPAPQPS